MSDTPTTLGRHIEIVSGFAFKSKQFGSDGELPIIRIRDVKRGFSTTRYTGDFKPKFLVNDGDLLVGMDGEFNAAVWRGGRSLLNQRVCRIYPTEGLNFDYLKHLLPAELKQIEDRTAFVTVKHLSAKQIRNIPVTLPPLPEQRRIADILDKADGIRRKRQEALKLTDEFLRSAFLEMFGDPVTNPKGWPVVKLGEVCKRVTDGTHQTPEWSPEGVPFLFISNIVNGEIDFGARKFITEQSWTALTARCPIEVNDILYTTVGSYGNAALVRAERRFCFQRHIAHIKPDPHKIHPEFLLGQMQSDGVRRQADRQARGVAQKTLNLRELKKFSILLPPSTLQHEYVALRRRVEGCRQRHREASTQSAELFDSLVQRAFRGEL